MKILRMAHSTASQRWGATTVTTVNFAMSADVPLLTSSSGTTGEAFWQNEDVVVDYAWRSYVPDFPVPCVATDPGVPDYIPLQPLGRR